MATSIDKNTRRLIEDKLDALFELQQSLNNNNTGSYGQSGLDISGVPAFGSFSPTLLNNLPFSFLNPSLKTDIYNPGKTRNIDFNFFWDIAKENAGPIARQLGQLSPMMYNIARGLSKPEEVKPVYNPYNDEIRSTMRDRRFNVNPLLNSNSIAQAISNRNISNVATSRGELLGGLTAAQNARMVADAAAFAQKNNMDNQYLAEQAQMDYNLGANKAQMDFGVQDYNLQNRAARNKFMSQGFNDLSKYLQLQKLMENQRLSDEDKKAILKDMYSSILKFMPGLSEILGIKE